MEAISPQNFPNQAEQKEVTKDNLLSSGTIQNQLLEHGFRSKKTKLQVTFTDESQCLPYSCGHGTVRIDAAATRPPYPSAHGPMCTVWAGNTLTGKTYIS